MKPSKTTCLLILAVTALSSTSPAWAGKGGFGDFEESRRVLNFLAAQKAAAEKGKAAPETPPPPPPPSELPPR